MIKKKQATEKCDKSLKINNIFNSTSNDPTAAKRLQSLSNMMIDMRDVMNQYGVEVSTNEIKAWLAMMEKAQKIELSEKDYDAFVSALEKAPSPKVLMSIQNLFQRKSPWDN